MLVQTPTPQVTPSTLDFSHDQLLLAGSKITFSDIYEKEMALPVVRGKYYRAEDVDNTFILLNGILTDVSQQAFRSHKQMTTLREELTHAQTQLTQREATLKQLALQSKHKLDQQDKDLQALHQENDQLRQAVAVLTAKLQETLQEKG